MSTFLFGYTIFFSILLIGSAMAKLILKLRGNYDETPKNVQREEMLVMPFVFIGLIGMFGFVYEITIFNSMFWQIYFVLIVLYSVIAFRFPKLKWMKAMVSTKKFLLISFVGLVISLPMIYMLGTYAFILLPSIASA